jgi:ABC-type hemin transport system ATPase subunit
MIVLQGGEVALDAPPDEVMNEDSIRRFFSFDARVANVGGRMWVVPRM